MSKTRSTMVYRTVIERLTSQSDDGGGYTQTWAPVSSNVPCYVWFVRGQELVLEGRPTVIDYRSVLVPRSTDVRESDRLVSITDRKGSTLFDGPLTVDSVGERPDHLLLSTRRLP